MYLAFPAKQPQRRTVENYESQTEYSFYIPFGGITRIRFYGYNLSPLL